MFILHRDWFHLHWLLYPFYQCRSWSVWMHHNTNINQCKQKGALDYQTCDVKYLYNIECIVSKNSHMHSVHFYKKHFKTRLHSNRMRTARALTLSPSMLCAGRGAWSGGCMVRGGAWSWGVVSQHALRQTPPVNRMTNSCKNITLPQTSFAGGNKYNSTNLNPNYGWLSNLWHTNNNTEHIFTVIILLSYSGIGGVSGRYGALFSMVN